MINGEFYKVQFNGNAHKNNGNGDCEGCDLNIQELDVCIDAPCPWDIVYKKINV